MAVFTEVSAGEAGELVHKLGLGSVRELRGIQGGIENTNFFLTTERDGVPHDYVLTLFERLSFEQLPFYLYLMKHLARRGIPAWCVPCACRRRRCCRRAPRSRGRRRWSQSGIRRDSSG